MQRNVRSFRKMEICTIQRECTFLGVSNLSSSSYENDRVESSAEYRLVAANVGPLLLERPSSNRESYATLVPVADEVSSSDDNNKIARTTCEMFEKMLKSDLSGLSTLEYLKNVTKRLKQRNCELSLDLLATLRHCKVNAALSKKKRARLKKKRKRMRQDEIAQALAEAEATEQKQEVLIRRADALRDLRVDYLSSSLKKKNNARKKLILPEAMGGLRRISHFEFRCCQRVASTFSACE